MKQLRHFIMFVWLGAAALPGVQAQSAMTFVMEPFPPFVSLDKGEATGPVPEVVRAVCAAIQTPCKFESLPWRRAFVMAELGQVDGIFVFVHTLEREKDFYFTDPVIQSGYALFVRQPSRLSYTGPKDVSGYTVAAYGPSGTSSAAEEIAKTSPGMRLEIEVDNNAVLRKLSAGRYTEPAAGFVNRDVGKLLIDQQKYSNLRLAGEAKRIDYAIGLSRKRMTQEQADRFILALRELIRKGTVKAIVEKHGLKAP